MTDVTVAIVVFAASVMLRLARGRPAFSCHGRPSVGIEPMSNPLQEDPHATACKDDQ